MAVSIISYDIAGSSYTNFIGVDYRKEAAVRKFLVDGDTVKDKVALIEDIRALLTTGSMNHHPNTEGSSSADGYKGLLMSLARHMLIRLSITEGRKLLENSSSITTALGMRLQTTNWC